MHPELHLPRPILGWFQENGRSVGWGLRRLRRFAGCAGEHGITYSAPAPDERMGVRWIPEKRTSKGIRVILRLQSLNALGDVAIIDVAPVDVHEVLEGGSLVASRFVGGGQFVVKRDTGFAVNSRHFQSFVVPADRGLWDSFFEKA